MKNIFKNEKFWLVAAGAAGVIVGKKIITAKKTRQHLAAIRVSMITSFLVDVFMNRESLFIMHCVISLVSVQ